MPYLIKPYQPNNEPFEDVMADVRQRVLLRNTVQRYFNARVFLNIDSLVRDKLHKTSFQRDIYYIFRGRYYSLYIGTVPTPDGLRPTIRSPQTLEDLRIMEEVDSLVVSCEQISKKEIIEFVSKVRRYPTFHLFMDLMLTFIGYNGEHYKYNMLSLEDSKQYLKPEAVKFIERIEKQITIDKLIN